VTGAGFSAVTRPSDRCGSAGFALLLVVLALLQVAGGLEWTDPSDSPWTAFLSADGGDSDGLADGAVDGDPPRHRVGPDDPFSSHLALAPTASSRSNVATAHAERAPPVL
jgi:hypothetical protein